MQCVVDVELACRGNNFWSLDDSLKFARLVIDNNDCRLLFLTTPDREPNLVARLVVLRLYDAFRSFAEICPFANRQNGEARIQIIHIKYSDALAERLVRVKWCVNP